MHIKNSSSQRELPSMLAQCIFDYTPKKLLRNRTWIDIRYIGV